MAKKGVVRIGDLHVCPQVTGNTPHIGGRVIEGQENITANGKPIAYKGAMVYCPAVNQKHPIVEGANWVFLNGKEAAYEGCRIAGGGRLVTASPNVMISSEEVTSTTERPDIYSLPFKMHVLSPHFNLIFENKVRKISCHLEQLKSA